MTSSSSALSSMDSDSMGLGHSTSSSSAAFPRPIGSSGINSQNSFLSSADIFNLNGNGQEGDEEEGDEEDDEYWTTEELLKELTRAFLDEAAAPKLLPEKLEMVDKMVFQMASIDKILAASSNKNGPICAAHRMELYRIEHVVNSYLRVRLKKIERSPALVLQAHSDRLQKAIAAQRAGKPMDQPTLLDRREVQFGQRLLEANSALFSDQFLKHIPASMQFVPVPRDTSAAQTRVFIQVLKDNLNRVPVPSMADPNADILVSLCKDTRHLIPFHCVEELLEQGDINLL